jgi:hypothetical protein
MSTSIILVPIVIASWPAITAAVAAAAAGLGITALQKEGEVQEYLTEADKNQLRTVEVELAKSTTALASMSRAQEIVVTKGDIELRVKSSETGRCHVCASGRGKSKAQLEQAAEEFAGRITQAYVYNKVMNEIRAKGLKVANEEVMKDQSIRISVRNEVE